VACGRILISEATLQEELATDQFENRAQYFHIAGLILQDHFFGVGLNNWSYWVSKLYAHKAGVDVYQDYDDIPAYILESNANWDDTYAPPGHNLAVITAGEDRKTGVALGDVVGAVTAELDRQQKALLDDATALRESRTADVKTVDEAIDAAREGFARIPYAALGDDGEDKLAAEAVTVRCLQSADGGVPASEDEPGIIAWVARSY